MTDVPESDSLVSTRLEHLHELLILFSQKSKEMKTKGNEQFQRKKYDLAVKWYTKAIKYQ